MHADSAMCTFSLTRSCVVKRVCGVDPQDLRSIYVFFKKNIEPRSYFIYSYNYGDQKFYPDGDVLNAKSTEVLN